MKKTYVVTLDNCNRRKPIRDSLIVKASSAEAAITSARKISVRLPGKSHATVREACPIVDLGCQTKAEFLALCDYIQAIRQREEKA